MDFEQMLFHDLDWSFAAEIGLRTLVMFTVILLFLRLSGKKGVRQLSIFEVAIVIGLGSAAGDPMSNEQNAIVPALIVFSTILLFYRFITWLASRSEKFESVLEGDPIYVIEDGQFVLNNTQTGYAKDEFFSEMRQQSIEHVGQVRTAILETNGSVSFFFYADDEVKSGLPVLPKVFGQRSKHMNHKGLYACTTCANVQQLDAGRHTCVRCHQDEWVQAMASKRLA